MARADRFTMFALVILAGFLGGAFATFVLIGSPALATEASEPADIIRAQAFQLIDDEGNVRANLSFARIEKPLYAKVDGIAGRVQVLRLPQPVPFEQGVVFELLNEKGKVIWQAPGETRAMLIHGR